MRRNTIYESSAARTVAAIPYVSLVTFFAHQFKHKTSFSTAAVAPRVKIALSKGVDIKLSSLLSMSCSFVNLAPPRSGLASDLPTLRCALAP